MYRRRFRSRFRRRGYVGRRRRYPGRRRLRRLRIGFRY